MRITDLKINGVREPMGFDLPRVTVSWKVEETRSRRAAAAELSIAADAAFADVLWKKEGADLASVGETAELCLRPRTRYHVRVSVTGDAGDSAEAMSFFETGKEDEPWAGRWIAPRENDGRHPLFFRAFELSGKIRSARLYMTGLGLYEAELNGRPVGDELMAPCWTDYSGLIQAQTYDVTEWLREGENLLTAACGNGWYKGRLGYEGQREIYGNRFRLLAELRVLAEDGTETVIATDGSWRYRGSDFESTDIYDGERLNRLLWKDRDNPDTPAEVPEEFDTKPVRGRLSLPVKVMDRLPVREVIQTPAGETVLDFGQNFTGCVEYEADCPAGTVITLDHGEILQGGNFYNENYRSAKAQMIYVSDGRKETVRAHFTFFGFRYVRVTGWPGEVRKERFTGRVTYSALDTVIRFASGNEKLNRLAANAYWGQRSNFLDVPTDCPQRDERLGWTGDAQVFSPTACFQMDTRAFYRKYLNDLRMDQVRSGGAIANYAPNFSGPAAGSSVWGDVATFLPVTLYDFYGDRELLREQLPLMRDWVGWIKAQDEAHGGKRLWNFGFHFGDWLAMDGMTSQSMKGGTEDFYIASMYYYASARKLEKAEAAVGDPEKAEQARALAEEIREAILQEYFTPAGRLASDTQTSYLLALNFGVYRDPDRLMEGLKTRFRKDMYRLKGGFVGATMMCRVLAENGMADLAEYLLFQEGFPGWMHCVNLGATTIWERWNSVLDDGSISGTGMNSLNHYSYGSVMEYVYRDLAGIQGLESGFTRARLAPRPTWKAGFMECSFNSASGTYESGWRIHPDGTLTVRFRVPFGCTAEAVWPGTGEVTELEAGEYERTYRPEKDYRLKYSMGTRPEELKDDPEAMEILKEDLPRVWQIAAGGDPELASASFGELQTMFFFGFNPEMIQEGTRRLFLLRGV